MENSSSMAPSRRAFLAGGVSAVVLGVSSPLWAHSYKGGRMPWVTGTDGPPPVVKPGGWYFFSPAELALVTAIADRIVPEDELSPSASKMGVIVYIDRQLVGSYGNSSRLYTAGPFLPGLPTQGYQGKDTPAERYHKGLAAIGAYVQQKTPGKSLGSWSADDQDAFLKDLEAGKIKLANGVDGKAFFSLVIDNVMEGVFADPIYGGNKDMAGWKMVGFPGARYDYRDWVSKHNQPYTLPPVSIQGAAQWTAKGN